MFYRLTSKRVLGRMDNLSCKHIEHREVQKPCSVRGTDKSWPGRGLNLTEERKKLKTKERSLYQSLTSLDQLNCGLPYCYFLREQKCFAFFHVYTAPSNSIWTLNLTASSQFACFTAVNHNYGSNRLKA